MTIKLQLREGGSVALNGLANTPVPTIKLHGTPNFEGRRVRCIPRNSDQDKPFLVCTSTIVDDLCTDKGCVTVEDFLRW